MHRLQCLLFGRQPVRADPLHPEPHDGRGMAQGLAPRTDRAARVGQRRCWSWAQGPRGWRRPARLALRGYRVALAEAGRVLGGRVVREAALPGMREYIRVRDWREGQIAKMPNVEVFRESRLTRAGCARLRGRPCRASPPARAGGVTSSPASGSSPSPTTPRPVFTPDDIMDGRLPEGPVVVYDADGYYMGGVIAEQLRAAGLEVTLVTPRRPGLALGREHRRRLAGAGASDGPGHPLMTAQGLSWFDGAGVTLACAHSGP